MDRQGRRYGPSYRDGIARTKLVTARMQLVTSAHWLVGEPRDLQAVKERGGEDVDPICHL